MQGMLVPLISVMHRNSFHLLRPAQVSPSAPKLKMLQSIPQLLQGVLVLQLGLSGLRGMKIVSLIVLPYIIQQAQMQAWEHEACHGP